MNNVGQKNNSIDEFYLAAREYCRLLENIQDKSKQEFLSNSQKILTLIYLKATLLQQPELMEDGETEKLVQEEDWNFIQNSVSAKLGSSDRFIEIILPDRPEPDNIESENLSDCFADIYQDLKDLSLIYEFDNTEALQVGLAECILNFEKLWGPRLLAVLVRVHCIINSTEAIEDEELKTNSEQNRIKNSETSNWLINQRFDE